MAKRARWLAAGAAGVVVAAVAGTIWGHERGPALPVVNQAQARAMLPVINSYVSQHARSIMGAAQLPHGKWFCDSGIFDITVDRQRSRADVEIQCVDFATRGHTLLEGEGGYPAMAEYVILARDHGHYRVLSLRIGPYDYDAATVDRMYPPAAAAEINSAHPPTAPDPVRLARQAFGFPADTQPRLVG
jgi:hypothetical protein